MLLRTRKSLALFKLAAWSNIVIVKCGSRTKVTVSKEWEFKEIEFDKVTDAANVEFKLRIFTTHFY